MWYDLHLQNLYINVRMSAVSQASLLFDKYDRTKQSFLVKWQPCFRAGNRAQDWTIMVLHGRKKDNREALASALQPALHHCMLISLIIL